MDWNTLFSVALGGLIAIIPVIISNRFQAEENERNRKEQRKEYNFQAIEKSLGGDIDKALGLLAVFIKRISEDKQSESIKKGLETKRKSKLISENEFKKEVSLLLNSLLSQKREIDSLIASLSGIMYSFDETIAIEYSCFIMLYFDFFGLHIKDDENSSEQWQNMILQAGKLQRILREKKISIRMDK